MLCNPAIALTFFNGFPDNSSSVIFVKFLRGVKSVIWLSLSSNPIKLFKYCTPSIVVTPVPNADKVVIPSKSACVTVSVTLDFPAAILIAFARAGSGKITLIAVGCVMLSARTSTPWLVVTYRLNPRIAVTIKTSLNTEFHRFFIIPLLLFKLDSLIILLNKSLIIDTLF
ncbi:hypothetical protein X847_1054 [Listeria monocytogenes Lm_1889]|nr:hypothetical protein X847_1054 [Listeria monocytogenes Lm_1889]RKC91599.1 hypothetical protein AF818_02655 [Listeria monocytogenes]